MILKEDFLNEKEMKVIDVEKNWRNNYKRKENAIKAAGFTTVQYILTLNNLLKKSEVELIEPNFVRSIKRLKTKRLNERSLAL